MGTRTPDLYRVNFEVNNLKPFACLAFPQTTYLKTPRKQPIFGDELVTSFCRSTSPIRIFCKNGFGTRRGHATNGVIASQGIVSRNETVSAVSQQSVVAMQSPLPGDAYSLLPLTPTICGETIRASSPLRRPVSNRSEVQHPLRRMTAHPGPGKDPNLKRAKARGSGGVPKTRWAKQFV